MSSAARAYNYYGGQGTSAPARPYAPARPNVRVIPGGRPAQQTGSSAIASLFIVIALAIGAIALFAAAHVWLDSESVTYSVQAQAVSNDLIEVRHQGSLLEVEVSALANPARIQEEANALGMIAPDSATIIKLGADVVATDSAGNLSLAESARILSNAASRS